MRHLYLCMLAATMLLANACSKDGTSETPVPQPDKTKVIFNYDKIGSFEISSMLNGPGIYAKVSNGMPGRAFTYELVGSNGLKKATDTTVKGSSKLDANGGATLELNRLTNYRDGEMILKVTFSGPDATIQAKTEKAEYKVRDYHDFINMAITRDSDTSDHYIQVQDFAFPDTLFDRSPCIRGMRGSYDGQGHKITNLKISAPLKENLSSYIGLFPFADSGSTIKNIRLELAPAGIVGVDAAMGGIVGFSRQANIIACSVKGDLVADKNKSAYVGGISGFNDNTNMIGCSFRGHLRGNNVGGLMGSFDNCRINMSYAYFSFDAYAAGGLAGLGGEGGHISNSYTIVHDHNTDFYKFVAIGPTLATGANVITNCFALSGTPEAGVKMGATISELGIQAGALEVVEWPAGTTAPADKRPFKLDTDLNQPLKLWWE
ncbi:hypothetical protein [Chitinophaga sp. S165]|uniref:hypothetical protein n=1 Tax=Chitinophaga sp. S165 TaxID=2135462 RepID=UPI000D8BC5DF|nr:hypothetical protein [Chitinophaga sp. S165]PWV49791.1 hypothetical protein C7475_105299 [Chitinophaga sp. S165]